MAKSATVAKRSAYDGQVSDCVPLARPWVALLIERLYFSPFGGIWLDHAISRNLRISDRRGPRG